MVRHHLDPSVFQRTVHDALAPAGISKHAGVQADHSGHTREPAMATRIPLALLALLCGEPPSAGSRPLPQNSTVAREGRKEVQEAQERRMGTLPAFVATLVLILPPRPRPATVPRTIRITTTKKRPALRSLS